MRILVSWVGHTDLKAMAQDLPRSYQEKIKGIVGSIEPPKGGLGPIKTLISKEVFDQIHILSNYPSDIGNTFGKWINQKVKIHSVVLDSPTDYKEIFTAVNERLLAITSELKTEKYELCMLLSPGTPAMAAIWVLLGKSKYPATFYQTFEGKAWVTDIPFDLALDFVPDLLKKPDTVLQHLASKSPREIEGFKDIIGDSQAIRIAVGRARKAAMRDVSVLLLGESGTGKELFARAIHAASQRKNGPFIPINCAAIPQELLESELFGHMKGAFSGAEKNRDGAFKLADGGILFLDEIGECNLTLQAKLLRVLQSIPEGGPCVREFYPVGSTKLERCNTRILAATNRNLLEAVEKGLFRADLYYRLAVISIKLPPLRDRMSDIPGLAAFILDRINKDFASQEPGYKNKYFSASANSFVKHYNWPGNVRELTNVLLQAAVMAEDDKLTREDLELAISELPGMKKDNDILEHPLGDGFHLQEHLDRIQAYYLQKAMNEANGVKSKAARLLGIEKYQTLDAQLKRLQVDWKERT
jgi:DNA-binding NtrC family response regulator